MIQCSNTINQLKPNMKQSSRHQQKMVDNQDLQLVDLQLLIAFEQDLDERNALLQSHRESVSTMPLQQTMANKFSFEHSKPGSRERRQKIKGKIFANSNFAQEEEDNKELGEGEHRNWVQSGPKILNLLPPQKGQVNKHRTIGRIDISRQQQNVSNQGQLNVQTPVRGSDETQTMKGQINRNSNPEQSYVAQIIKMGNTQARKHRQQKLKIRQMNERFSSGVSFANLLPNAQGGQIQRYSLERLTNSGELCAKEKIAYEQGQKPEKSPSPPSLSRLSSINLEELLFKKGLSAQEVFKMKQSVKQQALKNAYVTRTQKRILENHEFMLPSCINSFKPLLAPDLNQPKELGENRNSNYRHSTQAQKDMHQVRRLLTETDQDNAISQANFIQSASHLDYPSDQHLTMKSIYQHSSNLQTQFSRQSSDTQAKVPKMLLVNSILGKEAKRPNLKNDCDQQMRYQGSHKTKSQENVAHEQNQSSGQALFDRLKPQTNSLNENEIKAATNQMGSYPRYVKKQTKTNKNQMQFLDIQEVIKLRKETQRALYIRLQGRMTPNLRLPEHTSNIQEFNEYHSKEDELPKSMNNKFFSARSSALEQKPKSSLFDGQSSIRSKQEQRGDTFEQYLNENMPFALPKTRNSEILEQKNTYTSLQSRFNANELAYLSGYQGKNPIIGQNRKALDSLLNENLANLPQVSTTKSCHKKNRFKTKGLSINSQNSYNMLKMIESTVRETKQRWSNLEKSNKELTKAPHGTPLTQSSCMVQPSADYDRQRFSCQTHKEKQRGLSIDLDADFSAQLQLQGQSLESQKVRPANLGLSGKKSRAAEGNKVVQFSSKLSTYMNSDHLVQDGKIVFKRRSIEKPNIIGTRAPHF